MKKKYLVVTMLALVLFLVGIVYILMSEWRGNEYLSYESSTYGFSFEYPKSWYPLGLEEGSTVIQLSDVSEESGDGGVPLGTVIEIYVIENYDGVTFEEWINQKVAEEVLEILEEDTFEGDYTVFNRRIFSPLSDLIDTGPVINAYNSLLNESFFVQINYIGREPNYTAGLKYFEHLLKTFLIKDNSGEGAAGVVDRYMKYTLGTIPDATLDYSAAKKLLSVTLADQFTDDTFVPSSYCIQEGPDDVIISSNVYGETNEKVLVVEAQYGEEWREMWNFRLELAENGTWVITDIECI